MKLKIGQHWISEDYPHENFEIYGGDIDTCVDAFSDYELEFDEQPETCKIFFWKRTDLDSFYNYLESKGITRNNTYPYAWCGESKKHSLVSKIKKYNMKLS